MWAGPPAGGPPLGSLAEQHGLTEWLPGRLAAAKPSIVVIGDVMLDGWWEGSIDRFCREAPAPVVEIRHRRFAPGGAANTAMNLAALGAHVTLASVVGRDDAGSELLRRLREEGIDTGYVQHVPGFPTTTKTRISSGGQILLRIDDSSPDVPEASLGALAQSLRAALQGQQAVVLCDYGAGALTGPVRDALLEFLVERPSTLMVVVDAHEPHAWASLHPDLATPNAQEAGRLLGRTFPEGPGRAAAVVSNRTALLEATGAANVVVTLDRDGTVLLPSAGKIHRTWARPVAERHASGAGDTFVAALTIASVASLPLTTSVDLAQAAADVAVHRSGTSVCSTEDLARHLGGFAQTILDPEDLARLISRHRGEGQRIVLTNGCFDVLHPGHTRYLNQAKHLGDVLVVALNSDASVRELKGPGRPVNKLTDRAAVIGALSCVDYVTVFDTPTPIPLIDRLQPEVYAKGGDYTPAMLAETPAVEAYGGQVAILDYVAELSTTAVVERIRKGEAFDPGTDGTTNGEKLVTRRKSPH